MPTRLPDRSPSFGDQAEGLRQLMWHQRRASPIAGAVSRGDRRQPAAPQAAARRLRFVPLVHNPQVSDAGVVMERLCSAFAEQGLHTLVVDAADSASPPHELATVDLSACVETLSTEVSYLAARGLALNYLDSSASLAGFLEALGRAAPRADVLLLHAGAIDLRRMFVGRRPCPVLLVGGRSDSLMPAYAAMKLLSQGLGPMTYDLVIAGDTPPELARQMADRLGHCGDYFLGAALRHLAVLDPLTPPQAPPAIDLLRLASAQVAPATACIAGASGERLHGATARPTERPAERLSVRLSDRPRERPNERPNEHPSERHLPLTIAPALAASIELHRT